MKMKEVIARTGLTDRAIRLYIENGLVFPENHISYTGRNSYEFSEESIRGLKQIATLRKADFSIEQIKILQAGGREAHAVLSEYLQDKAQAVQTGQRILSALDNLPEEFSLEDLCARLQVGMQTQPLPQADTEVTKAERTEQKTLLILCGVCLLLGLVHIAMWIADKRIFPFPQFHTDWEYYIGIVLILIPIVPLGIVLSWYARAPLNSKKKTGRRKKAIAILMISFVIYLSPVTLLLQILSPIYSETRDPANYLVLGENATGSFLDDIYKLFPTSIPNSLVDKNPWPIEDRYGDSVRYYYRYENDLDPEFHIFAQWTLPPKEYETEKQRIRNYYADSHAQTARKGSWACLCFSADPLDQAGELGSYYYLLFAYNDATREVRYIVTYCLDVGKTNLPYFMTLDWD